MQLNLDLVRSRLGDSGGLLVRLGFLGGGGFGSSTLSVGLLSRGRFGSLHLGVALSLDLIRSGLVGCDISLLVRLLLLGSCGFGSNALRFSLLSLRQCRCLQFRVALGFGLFSSGLGDNGGLLVHLRLLGSCCFRSNAHSLGLLSRSRYRSLQLRVALSVVSQRLLGSSSFGGGELSLSLVCSCSLHLRCLVCRRLLLQLSTCLSRRHAVCRS